MIAYEEALARVLAHTRPLPPERIPLEAAMGRYLARDVTAREPIPRYDQSAVDGYGVRFGDVQGASEAHPVRFSLLGEIRAGDSGDFRMPHAACRLSTVRLFTGAPVPPGIEAVVMKEFCQAEGRDVLIRQSVAVGANIRRQGEEFGKGTKVLSAGTRVTPPVVGLLATLGGARPEVHRLPRVALIVTGSELRAPGERLKAGQIRDANSYALAAALKALGIEAASVERAPDDHIAIRECMADALARADVLVTVGGVSVGDYDFVKEAAAELGAQTVFWRVAVKPGMPIYFGIMAGGKGKAAQKKLVFGLPGNPVAALVSLRQFVRPALLKLAGARDLQSLHLNAILRGTCRKKSGRLEWVRGVATFDGARGTTVTPTGGQESHMLGGLAAANCLIEFPAESEALNPGEVVRVQLLEWVGA